jgi:hypothetical protein
MSGVSCTVASMSYANCAHEKSRNRPRGRADSYLRRVRRRVAAGGQEPVELHFNIDDDPHPPR